MARPKQPIAAGDDKSYEDKGATWRKEDALNRKLTIDLNWQAIRRV